MEEKKGRGGGGGGGGEGGKAWDGGRDGVNVHVDDESWHCRSLAELKVVMNLLAVVEPWQMAQMGGGDWRPEAPSRETAIVDCSCKRTAVSQQ